MVRSLRGQRWGLTVTATTFAGAINDALSVALAVDPNVICYGLGVDDPKGVFGTTIGLQQRFGPERVFDMPTSENAMTGIGIGAALYGLRPVMTHQRLDFALLSMDQLVNNAAKWRFMFGGKRGVPDGAHDSREGLGAGAHSLAKSAGMVRTCPWA